MAGRTRPWFYYFGNRVMRAVFNLILDIKIRGGDNVPRQGPLIVAISHSSFMDPLLAGVYTPRDVIPMAKKEAFDLPVLGAVIKWYGAFPVRRGQVDVSAFKTALHILDSGQAMVIAPEGHRSESGALQRGREGAIMLSLRSGAPILPVAVWGGKSFWHNLAHLHRTAMWYYMGEPVVPEAFGTKPSRQAIAEMSDELMVRIAEMMPPEVRGYYADLSQVTTHHLKAYRQAGPAPTRQKEVMTHRVS